MELINPEKLKLIKIFRRTLCCMIMLQMGYIVDAYFVQINLFVFSLVMIITSFAIYKDICFIIENKYELDASYDIDINDFLEKHYNSVFSKNECTPIQEFWDQNRQLKDILEYTIIVLICMGFSFGMSFMFNDSRLILTIFNPMLLLVLIFK